MKVPYNNLDMQMQKSFLIVFILDFSRFDLTD